MQNLIAAKNNSSKAVDENKEWERDKGGWGTDGGETREMGGRNGEYRGMYAWNEEEYGLHGGEDAVIVGEVTIS